MKPIRASQIPGIAFSWFATAACAFLLAGTHACGSSNANASADAGSSDASSLATDGSANTDATSNNNGNACDEHVRYVAHASGLDSNDGCSAGYPKATIKAALDSLRQQNLAGYEVHVCAGNYDEAPVVVDFSVSVLGSYDCGTFDLPGDYGAPDFTGLSSNILPSPSAQHTFEISGSAVGTSTTIDGFQITGSDLGGSAAVHITSGAAPALSNLLIAGGAGVLTSVPANAPTYAPGSIGILVDQDASPLISNSQVTGGSGVSKSAKGLAGSVAIDVENAAEFLITGLQIDGGTGQGSAIGSAGVIDVSSAVTGVCEISESTITGGEGTSDVTASLGVSIADSRTKLNDAHIDGGAGTCVTTASPTCTITGVGVNLAGNAAALTITNNRILAARAGNPIAPSSAALRISSLGAAPANVTGGGGVVLNMIEPAHGTTAGIAIHNVNDVSILANTIAATSAETQSSGIMIDDSTGTTIEGNLIAAQTGIYLAAPNSEACPTLAKVDHNGFVVAGAIQHADATCALPDAVTIADLTAYANFSSNLRIAQTCTPDTAATCVPGCASQDACMLQVFTQDPSPSFLFATGFTPADAMPCLFVMGGLSASTVPDDTFGVARSSAPTIGAVSSDETCN